ncbi:TPA: hypothetical protein N6X42_002900 [Escherichia coli]|nr:hypothetical protein [Escherichia coli]
MTLTKEWLLKTISELEEERDAIPGAVNEDAAMALAAMKMALASLTAEPVVPDENYQHLSELYHSQEKRLFKLAQRIKGPSFDKYAYSLSQAIDVLETEIFGEKEDDVNGCSAAMLQDKAEPACTCPSGDGSLRWPCPVHSGNSPAIPDGWALVPVEPTAEMISSGIAAHYERSNIQIHDRPAPGPMECAYVAMLAAAPQQEV